MGTEQTTSRVVLRAVLIVVLVVAVLYVAYLLRRPLAWIVIAAFIAVALSGPVNLFARRMPRGLAIALVYLGVLLIPVALSALVIPPLVTQATELVQSFPRYVTDVNEFVSGNSTLQGLNEKYDITGKLEAEAATLPSRIGDAATTLRDLGVGVVNSVFAGITILFLSIFMVASGRRWVGSFLAHQPRERAERIRRTLDSMATAVGNYVGGALLQATIAGITTFVVLLILGVPSPATLAVIVALLDLLPLVGATIGAVLVGVVTLFANFPVATIVWTIWAIVYQQIENNVVQPQIQRRAVRIEPFVVLVAVLFGATLFGVVGAILAIPAAASVQIALREWLAFRSSAAAPQPPAGPPEPRGAEAG